MAHEHIVIDSDSRFIIDKATRQISTSSGNTTIMQFDHNSERLTFELPKLIDGHDMTKCNEVEVHYINIDSATKESKVGVYAVNDLQVDASNSEKATLSWLISNNATQYAGVLNFLIKFKCIVDGKVEYAWNTAKYTALTVSNGIDNGEIIAEEYADILAQWEERIADMEQGGGVSSWNDLTDKPFGVIGEGDKLEWDGDKNTPSVGLGFDGNSIGTFYKVSDNIITREDLANGFSVASYYSSVYHEVNSADFINSMPIEEKEDGILMIPVPDENGNLFYPFFVCCVPNGAMYEPGVYFGAQFYNDGAFDMVASITIPGYGKFPVNKPVAAEHLPAPLSFGETMSFTNTLTWNGSFEGLEVHSDPNQSDWYKLSDVVVTVEDLANGFYAEVVNPGDFSCSTYLYGTNDYVYDLDTTNPSDIQIAIYDENGNSWPAMRFTTDGVFVTHWHCSVTNWETEQTILFDNRVYSITIPGFNKFPATTNRTIDKKYLPKAEVVYELPEDYPVTGYEFNELLRALKNAGYLAT